MSSIPEDYINDLDLTDLKNHVEFLLDECLGHRITRNDFITGVLNSTVAVVSRELDRRYQESFELH